MPVTPSAAIPMPSALIYQLQNNAAARPAAMPLPPTYSHHLQDHAAAPPAPVLLPSVYAHHLQGNDLCWQRPPPGFGTQQQPPPASADWGFTPSTSADMPALSGSSVSMMPWRADVIAKPAGSQGKAPAPRVALVPRAPLRCLYICARAALSTQLAH